MTYNVFGGTLYLALSSTAIINRLKVGRGSAVAVTIRFDRVT